MGKFMEYQKCPVCRMPAHIHGLDPLGNDYVIDCVRCGSFRTVEDAGDLLSGGNLAPQQVAAISYYIRRNAGLTIDRRSVLALLARVMPTVPEKIARLLEELARRLPLPGESLHSPVWSVRRLENTIAATAASTAYGEGSFNDLELKSAAYLGQAGLVNGNELQWMIVDCLMPLGLVSEGGISGYLQITPKGWQEIARLQETNVDSRIGFVAMSFHASFLPLFDLAIAPGIVAAGYEAARVDRREHNNRIDDEIIALIKRSRFLVADFSRNRGGIYFEAGLAIGLGLPVIWTIREDRSERVHFDTRQFNHIRWTADKLPQFAKALQNRIEATIGRGPLPKTP